MEVILLGFNSLCRTEGIPRFSSHTLSANDGWPQVQATLAKGWGSNATESEFLDLSYDNPNRQPVGNRPEVAVLAAEKRFEWVMGIITSKKGNGPLGLVQDYVWKKEHQKRGAVHWHILLWCKKDTIPDHVVMAEVPRGPDTCCRISAYLRKLVLKLQKHTRCIPTRCFKGSFGKKLANCKYRFPFHVPEYSEGLDDDCVRYHYVRRHWEDRLVVPYNPEIAVLWGASHNIQRVSKHGFEQYLAKYISNPELSMKIELPENASNHRSIYV